MATKRHKGALRGVLLAAFCASLWPFSLGVKAELAVQLAGEGDHPAAAIEFRRLALEASDKSAGGGYYWAAAHEYWRAGEFGLADKMLDRAEDSAPDLGASALLLRAENAAAAQKWDEASFYLGSVLGSRAGDDAKSLAARRLAVAEMKREDAAAAREALAKSPSKPDTALAAIDRYEAGRDKSPKLGGVLGMIPGLGYIYAGEYANGLRSIILNGLFIFGMVDTAQDDEWGAFAAITFFEFTWYSGSIYGGIDASHRYNRRRLDDCIGGINGAAAFEPDYTALPTVTLKFKF